MNSNARIAMELMRIAKAITAGNEDETIDDEDERIGGEAEIIDDFVFSNFGFQVSDVSMNNRTDVFFVIPANEYANSKKLINYFSSGHTINVNGFEYGPYDVGFSDIYGIYLKASEPSLY